MKLVIEMELDNAAFADYGAEEVSRILASIGERIPDPLRSTDGALSLHDANGNYCGKAEIVLGEEDVRALADDHEAAEYEREGEAAYGRED